MEVYSRIKLFLQKVAWDRLPTHVLLRTRGLEILIAYLVYRFKNESVEHTLLWCPKARLIWWMAGGQPWRASSGSWMILFLATICRSSTKSPISVWGARMAYVAYQILLFKNSLVFDVVIMPAHRVLERALSLAIEYYCFVTTSLFVDALVP